MYNNLTDLGQGVGTDSKSNLETLVDGYKSGYKGFFSSIWNSARELVNNPMAVLERELNKSFSERVQQSIATITNSFPGSRILANNFKLIRASVAGDLYQFGYIGGELHAETTFEAGTLAAGGYAARIYRAFRGLGSTAKSSSSFMQLSSKIGRSSSGNRVFNLQARFPKANINIRLDRGFRAPFKNTKSPYLGKPFNGFNTHINIQRPGSFNYHIPLNPLKWKYYNIP